MTADTMIAGPGAPSTNVELARRIHDSVVPHLCGVVRVLAAEGELAPELQRRCHDEVTAALHELRALLSRSIAGDPGPWRPGGAPPLETLVNGAQVPAELLELTCSVLGEAVRNALRHADPSQVEARIAVSAGSLTLSVVSHSARQRAETTGLGLGLRLAAAAAARHEGRLEWGPDEERRWLVQLTVPTPMPSN